MPKRIDDAVILMVSDHHGIYVPQVFLDCAFGHTGWNINPYYAAVIDAGPDNEGYWDAWNDVLDSAQFIADNGDVYTLHQDGDVWAICYERMTEEEKTNFGFDE